MRPLLVRKTPGRADDTNVQVGTILIEDRPIMTRILDLESESYSGNWSVVNAIDGFALDRKIHAAGVIKGLQ